jgi:hypothetical protein
VESENTSLDRFPDSFPSENAQIHPQADHKPGNGELGDFPLSVEGKNENKIGVTSTPEVPESFPTFPSSRIDENHAQIPANSNGKPDGNLEWRANSCSPLCEVSSPNMERDTVKVSSITDFFYDDPTIPYAALPEHKLDQSPCYPIIVIKQGYYYCRLHPEIKNADLESIGHQSTKILKGMSQSYYSFSTPLLVSKDLIDSISSSCVCMSFFLM